MAEREWISISRRVPKKIAEFLNINKNKWNTPENLKNKFASFIDQKDDTRWKNWNFDKWCCPWTLILLDKKLIELFSLDENLLGCFVQSSNIIKDFYYLYGNDQTKNPPTMNNLKKLPQSILKFMDLTKDNIPILFDDDGFKDLFTELKQGGHNININIKKLVNIYFKENIHINNITSLVNFVDQFNEEQNKIIHLKPEKSILNDYFIGDICDIVVAYACNIELDYIEKKLFGRLIHDLISCLELNKDRLKDYKLGNDQDYLYDVDDDGSSYSYEKLMEYEIGDTEITNEPYFKMKKYINHIYSLYNGTQLLDFYSSFKKEKSLEQILEIKLPKRFSSIKIKNPHGFNDDERSTGEEHITINDLEGSYEHIINNNNMNIKDLLLCVMHVKSSKTDFWYELINGIERFIVNNNELIISLMIDHGS